MLLLLLAAQAVPVAEIRSGQSGPKEASERVIRDSAAWKEIWKSLQGGGSELPTVDFDRECVVLVAWGQQPRAGHSVLVKSIEIKDGEARIEVVRRKPSGGSATLLTYPYTLVRTARLPERVRFVDAT